MFKESYALTFGKKLFFSVIALFFIFVVSFIIYQHLREKEFRVSLLGTKVVDYNDIINQEYQRNPGFDLSQYINYLDVEGIRVTIIDLNGNVLKESSAIDNSLMGNHLERNEIQQALRLGTGVDVRRVSETTGIQYFYAASRYNNYIIRTAIPYSDSLTETLKTDFHYIWFALAVMLFLIFIFYKVVNHVGASLNQLREFALHIDRNEPYETIIESISGNDELSEISQHIIGIYQRLHDTKEALYIEKEKLIAHLQTSSEGLGVFTEDMKEILVNNLFTQYANLISDRNLGKTEDIFEVPELQPVINFIRTAQKKTIGKEGKRKSININKNGRVFMVESIIFQDLSFEISITDISQKEEKSLLKRQLTQNIAHELKTPVSSIQAYLETIVNNPDMESEKKNTFLRRCYEQSNRLTGLLRDISVLTRMDEAADMIEMEKVDISQIVRNIINEVSLELENKHITVDVQLREKMEIRGSSSLIYSIFRNLMDNSINYAGSNIQIRINNFREDDHLYYFSFSDTGIGVSSEHLQRLFERFYRVDKGRSRKLGGTGLGLAIVKNAVLIHGGSIFAKQIREGGLEFIFTLAKDR